MKSPVSQRVKDRRKDQAAEREEGEQTKKKQNKNEKKKERKRQRQRKPSQEMTTEEDENARQRVEWIDSSEEESIMSIVAMAIQEAAARAIAAEAAMIHTRFSSLVANGF